MMSAEFGTTAFCMYDGKTEEKNWFERNLRLTGDIGMFHFQNYFSDIVLRVILHDPIFANS